jgi:hypothetical protein
MRRCVVMFVRTARSERIFRLFFRAERIGGVGLDVFLRRGLEFGFAARAAEQHVLAIMREPMRRIRFDNHAANRISLLGGLRMVVSVMMMGVGVHVVLARDIALLNLLAPEPAPSHNGKVNTENSVLIL